MSHRSEAQPPPEQFSARIEALRRLSAGACELALSRPPGFQFSAGQWVTVFHAGLARDYSLVSAPHEQGLRICVRVVPGGRLSPQLARLPPGSRLGVSGPHGYFTFKPSARPPVFVATGVGVAPFCAMAASGVRGYTLLHGARESADLLYRAMVEASAARYVPCLSRERPVSPAQFGGRVTGFMNTGLPAGAYDFYLCGGQEMVRDAVRVIDARFPGSLAYSEVFF